MGIWKREWFILNYNSEFFTGMEENQREENSPLAETQTRYLQNASQTSYHSANQLWLDGSNEQFLRIQ
jgi:hypothetical protein